ncbi:DUF3152 domain-containing protein [Streptomyces poriticola]|uniref:DUF3152 domain-containing protein n=1 Tax=Streptomyces poriticola TaxID=3120506 RepID=UPI002FCDF296
MSSGGERPFPDGTPEQGVPRLPDGTPAHGSPRFQGGTPGAPAHGFSRPADGTPAHGFPRLPDGTPAHGSPRLPDGTPGYGYPHLPDGDGTPAHGGPRVRGGHPEHREAGGGWGEWGEQAGTGRAVPFPQQRKAPPTGLTGPTGEAGESGPTGPTGPVDPLGGPAGRSGPRREYLAAFDAFDASSGFDASDDVFTPRTPPRTPRRAPYGAPGPRDPSQTLDADPYASVTDWYPATESGSGGGTGTGSGLGAPEVPGDAPPVDAPAPAGGGKGRAFTGIAAAAVTTVLAVVVAGQVTDGRADEDPRSQSATDQARDIRDSASRTEERPTPTTPAPTPELTYEQRMSRTYPIDETLEGPGTFDAIPGIDKGPGAGRRYTYRVDVEQGLPLDGELFAQAVHRTLNDDRSWAHGGARTFERIHSGRPDFVITLASPGTTAVWCAKSGLDTTVDNVSCDSAATERVMINAYRWAQGAEPYGDDIHGYRQMLINHEIGHRIGFNHVTCDKDGELAPVMQQQTKFIDHDGIDCRPNPWPYPGS